MLDQFKELPGQVLTNAFKDFYTVAFFDISAQQVRNGHSREPSANNGDSNLTVTCAKHRKRIQPRAQRQDKKSKS